MLPEREVAISSVARKKGGVTLFIAQTRLLLAMKLNSGRGRRDAPDIQILLDACGIESVASAMEVFDRSYPTEVLPLINRQLFGKRFGAS